MVTDKEVIYQSLDSNEFIECVNKATQILDTIVDRKNLHARDVYERFNNILMGEIAEKMVIKWLHFNNKQAVSAHKEEDIGKPDPGYDIILKDSKSGRDVYCSVKSSLSYCKTPSTILKGLKLASTPDETTDVNIQVYFWLNLNPEDSKASRCTVPSLGNAAIISWLGQNDVENYTIFNRENRKVIDLKLNQGRAMTTLLDYIK